MSRVSARIALLALVAIAGATTASCRSFHNAILRNKGGMHAASFRDPAWDDGKAEKCVYAATRTIYGVERTYEAIAYTNKENLDPGTMCKAEDGNGRPVFKHHWSEIVPTENYAYRFSTMGYIDARDLDAVKLTASTQEDCGASFKECWSDGTVLRWWESVYFPGGGQRSGSLDRGPWTHFADMLTVQLRGFTWGGHLDGITGERYAEKYGVTLVPPQKDNHAVDWGLIRRDLLDVGVSVQDLPIGRVEAREVQLLDGDQIVARYWFATDATPPMLNALVRYEGPGGVTYKLKSIERTKYWER